MAHGVSEVLGEGSTVVKMLASKQQQHSSHIQQPQVPQQPLQHQQQQQQQSQQQSLRKSVGVMGSRRIFAPAFKLKVLDSYRNDIDCRGNQRATARKYGIHRRQIQKWLQCEDNLRSCCAEGNGNAATGSAGIITTPPASSPQKEPELQHQAAAAAAAAANNATPASPALNLSLARLHGDELAVQQQQPPPPPPPPPPSAAVAAQALATHQQQQQHQHHQANYRFHGAAAVAVPATTTTTTTTGYPDFKDKVPSIHQQHYGAQGSAAGDYSSMLELYQPLAYHHQHHRLSPPSHHHHHNHHQRYEADLQQQRPASNFQRAASFEAKVESSSASHQSEDDYHHHHHNHQQHSPSSSSSLLLLRASPAEIKTERASPDSVATPVPCDSAAASAHSHVHSSASDSEKQHSQPPHCILKKERLDEDEQQEREADYQRASLTSNSSHGSISDSSSPVPSHHNESFESLPPSPRDSDRSTTSSDSEMDYSLSGQHPGSNASDLTRRRSFSLRFKLDVLDAFHRDAGVAGNQRATARKFGINRRQVQKWLGQESELRGVIELCGSNNRQRLGPVQECGYTDETPVDLRTSGMTTITTTDLGQISPHSVSSRSSQFNCCDYVAASTSPSNYVDSSLTPPYSAPGCSLSCCQEAPLSNVSSYPYYCYSPELDISSSNSVSLKRSLCSQSCCYPEAPAAKKACLEEKTCIKEEQASQPEQETPLCLVKPKWNGQQVEPDSSTVPTPPAVTPPKKDAILFKPYLDNPVSKPTSDEAPNNNNENINNNNNNNCQSNCNLNERNAQSVALELSFKLPASWRAQPQQQQPQPEQQPQQQPQQQQQSRTVQHHSSYLEFPHVRSAFVRYPASAHYS